MPDFRMAQNSFPIASVIDAAQRNAQLQQQARESGNQSLIQGLQSIGQIGQSLYDTKMRVAQAMAQSQLLSQTPEGQQFLGTNQVTSTPQGPVTKNQTASFNPTTGSVTSNQSPNSQQTMASALLGIAPKDFLEHLSRSSTARTAQGELALKQQYEPQKIAIEGRKADAEAKNAEALRTLQAIIGAGNAANQVRERDQADEKIAFDADKETAKGFPIFQDVRDARERLANIGRHRPGSKNTFATEADAEKAGLTDGTPVIVGGVKGTWRHK